MRRFKLLIALLLCVLLCGCTGRSSVSGEGLWVHFLDVGQADCALLQCDGEYILIDGGNVGDSSLVVSYLEQAGVEELKAVICTHPHEDHVGGLAGVLAVYPTEAVYAPTRTYASDCFDDFVYYTDQQGLEITIPQVGDTIAFGQAEAEILGPTQSYAELNNTSIVMMVTYGSNRFLFTGDMETAAESDLMENGAKLKADVLKVGHHGSDSSTSYRLLYEVNPEYAVISVGKDNQYGHPDEVPLSRLEDAEVTVYRTDLHGTVVVHSNGSTLTITTEGNVNPTKPSAGKTLYIGNKNSKKLHLEGCSSLPAEKNQVIFGDLQEALEAGYSYCSKCME